MKVLIEINCENEAFGDNIGSEINRILSNIIRHIDVIGLKRKIHLYDINGNKVSELRIEE